MAVYFTKDLIPSFLNCRAKIDSPKLAAVNTATPIPSERRYGAAMADISESATAKEQDTRRVILVYRRSLMILDTANTVSAISARIKRIFMLSSYIK